MPDITFCDICHCDLRDELSATIAHTPMGKQRAILTCPECGNTYALDLTWTPQIVGGLPKSARPMPA